METVRVHFFSEFDLSVGFQVGRATDLARDFDTANPPGEVSDVVELYNVALYLEHGLLEHSQASGEDARVLAKLPDIHRAIAQFFRCIDEGNVAFYVNNVEAQYRGQLLDLMSQHKVFLTCKAEVVLPVLLRAGFATAHLLEAKSLVNAYDVSLRKVILESARAGETLLRKFLEKDARRSIYLPKSLTRHDIRQILEAYISGDSANLNYVRLIANAGDVRDAGIDAKLRLLAKRRADQLNDDLLGEGSTWKSGVDIVLNREQEAAVIVSTDSSDGFLQKFSYGEGWLNSTLDYSSILNNFQHLFEFTDRNVLLSFPSYPSAFGTFERLLGVNGATEYKTSASFRLIDSASMLQVAMYRNYLEVQGIDLESVICWFCDTYIPENFQAPPFRYYSSEAGAPYLQKARHLFAEMESLASQFRLFVENGELDWELLAVSAEMVRYKALPSLVASKYVYISEQKHATIAINLLFSDQSQICYIGDTSSHQTAAQLIATNAVKYEDFQEYQRPYIDWLLEQGVLRIERGVVVFASLPQIAVLYQLNAVQSANYCRLSDSERECVDDLVSRGWLTRRSSLLTEAEGDYFNYFLNRASFTNGPNLRNAYLHGSQAGDLDETHYTTYIVALRLLISLVIKMNDDLCIWAQP